MRRILLVAFIISGLILGGYYAHRQYKRNEEARQRLLLLKKREDAWVRLKKKLEREIVRFRGQVCIVIKDLKTGWEFCYNKDKLIPSASLVKIPIMLSYFYASSDGRVDLQETVELNRLQKTAGSGLLKNAAAGSVFSVDELIELMITRSDNTAANLLIDLLGLDVLNSYFAKLGLKQTNLSRKMMDFDERKRGIENYTTAQEMADLLEGIYRKQILNSDISLKCMRLLAKQKIKDRIPKRLPEEALVAHKTGLEYGICHDVGIVYTDKGDFLICVLTKHNNRYAQPAKRFISNIALTAYNYYDNL